MGWGGKFRFALQHSGSRSEQVIVSFSIFIASSDIIEVAGVVFFCIHFVFSEILKNPEYFFCIFFVFFGYFRISSFSCVLYFFCIFLVFRFVCRFVFFLYFFGIFLVFFVY